MDDRALILSRIRAALADVPATEPATWTPDDADPAVRYRGDISHDRAWLAQRFAERCGEYKAVVTRCGGDSGSIAAEVGAAAARHNARQLVAPLGWPQEISPQQAEIRVDDPPLSLAELDAADGVLSLCAIAIAETGTLVLDGRAGQGRRALTLVPDLHICVVRESQIVAGVPEAIARLEKAVRTDRRPLTMISGPSATSDIELHRVEGVHGPRRLEVIIAT